MNAPLVGELPARVRNKPLKLSCLPAPIEKGAGRADAFPKVL